MEHHEIISIDLPDTLFDHAVNEALEYGIISVPFTYNRMSIRHISRRILNIAKGKLSEKIFKIFCHANDIPIKTDQCETPFYLPDKKDFILGDEEWDLKNNYIYHDGDLLNSKDYIALPALIPNRGKWDQWSKRNSIAHLHQASKNIYLFSFMKGWDYVNQKRVHPFLSFTINQKQETFLDSLSKKYKQNTYSEAPFEMDWFWYQMKKYGGEFMYESSTYYRPKVILTGYSGETEWKYFSPIDPTSFKSDFFSMRIKNMGASLNHLKPFKSLYPNLYDSITFGNSL